ncbi:hypothetical protein PIIN_03540 [Serendipita indica DSM 11827]|uniref:Uncharacterized protein n=1 Tax=Serendipita indica (strain DSM 11827) TaxID=1109443 RepID=G4TE58_SERID|nr:hypothetical protein PIIN_03540 [Serendipita indica DSM 11827]
MAVATARADTAELRQRHKRQNYTICSSECTAYTTTLSSCSLNVATYSSCICSSQMVSDILSCVNCGVAAATSQIEINQAQTIINTWVSTCSTLGYPISIVPTARPTVSFPCTEPGPAATASASNPLASFTAPNAAGTTSTRPSATGAPSVSIPGFSFDSSQLNQLSSIFNMLSDELNSLTLTP